MKRLFLPTILTLLLPGCYSAEKEFNELSPPIILAGKDGKGCIVTCDSKNKYTAFSDNFYISRVIHNSYNVGDTILYFNK